MKDLRIQGVALAAKWICREIQGNEPWKILIRHNICNIVPIHVKRWNNLGFNDILTLNIDFKVGGSVTFRSIWKCWKFVRTFIKGQGCVDNNGCLGWDRSIWWNLSHNDKPLALLQG